MSGKKPKIREVILVEGRYDKNALSQCVDAVIVESAGFGIFRDKKKVAMLRAMAEKRGLILLTDSDGAGFVIRNHLKGMLGDLPVKQAYIPDIPGKERRKAAPSKEGKLGVEGMPPRILLEALIRAGATVDDAEAPLPEDPVTKADFAALGLSGGPDSAARRAALIRALDLPEHMSANALLQAVGALYTKAEFYALVRDLP